MMRLIGAPPLTLMDLIRQRPDIACRRQLGASKLRELLGRDKGECTWCGFGLTGRQRTFCGIDCVHAFMSHCDPGFAAGVAYKRDWPDCQLCGRDIEFWKVIYRRAIKAGKVISEQAKTATFGFARGRWSEIDHIVPVVEGGGLLGPSNLRLVCGKCHLEVTNELAARRRKGR